ncbi:hypothetical protein BC937DRAFT_86664 [Endogone sp. FLAS-F59071]|nr:hypothetical protein BC937DRAFT_86664 [Endogone sp. FLAS-F59071]|eukprot:RUS19949.1 hypothetical protein BC937DRAFT_86664 [Endogone sp. FLAS-F59071]
MLASTSTPAPSSVTTLTFGRMITSPSESALTIPIFEPPTSIASTMPTHPQLTAAEEFRRNLARMNLDMEEEEEEEDGEKSSFYYFYIHVCILQISLKYQVEVNIDCLNL